MMVSTSTVQSAFSVAASAVAVCMYAEGPCLLLMRGVKCQSIVMFWKAASTGHDGVYYIDGEHGSFI
jgi:hypothetical protein